MMEDDVFGTRFDEFLAEHVRPLAILPDPNKNEDVYIKAWDELVEHLEHASAEELVAYVWELVTRAIETQQYTKARNLACFAGMNEAEKHVNQAWLDNLYRRWQSTNEQAQRRKLCEEFIDNRDIYGIQNDQRFEEIRCWDTLDKIRELYRFKNKMKSGEAFAMAMPLIQKFRTNLRELDPELFSQVHTDAVKEVERASSADDLYEGGERSMRQARDLIEKYLDLGILDFEQDEQLIDQFTKTQRDNR